MVLSAGIAIVRNEDKTWKYLFLRAYKNWDFPKGEVEPGEDALQTAVREAKEETGITDLKFNWGTVYKETAPYLNGRKIARYYVAETTQSQVKFSINPEIGMPEHHEYRWLSYEEIKHLAPERLSPIIEWANGVIERIRF